MFFLLHINKTLFLQQPQVIRAALRLVDHTAHANLSTITLFATACKVTLAIHQTVDQSA